MERENYIETILNSTNGITKVTPSDDLFSKIQSRIQSENKFSTKTIWLVAASIVVLLTINISVILKNKGVVKDKMEISLAATLNKSNQLY
jgi:hypothetical protein